MFGKVLKEFINKKYESLAKFSEVCGISSGHLSDIITGRILPKYSKLEIFIKNLQPLTQNDEKLLLREWAFDKSDGILRKDFEEIENKNKNMLDVLKKLETEKNLLEEIAKLKEYEAFYNLIFNDMTSSETKMLLNAITSKFKEMAFESKKTELLKEKFEKLEEIMNKI